MESLEQHTLAALDLSLSTLVDVDLPFLRLLSRSPLSEDAQLVEFNVGPQSYRFCVLRVRREPDGTCWVRSLEPDRRGEILRHRFLYQRALDRESERRDDSRTRTTLSVTSPDLPSQRGTTFDISETGLRLVTEKPVPVGKKLRLVIRKDEEQEVVEVEGESVWSAPRANSLHHVGIRLVSPR
jgi:PilZ domain